ncbi:MAG: hypothetical protein HON21_13300 [Gammaproteobacteria bacterium]|jgi:hypothetical protein|nr:hypothetical protein [Gammaproteobacteria bacterium]
MLSEKSRQGRNAIKRVIPILCLLVSHAALADSYDCTVKASGGLKFENDEFVGTRFNPKERYILRKATDEDRDSLVVRYARFNIDRVSWVLMGTKDGYISDRQVCSDGGSQIHCKGSAGEFRFDRQSGRFIYSDLGDYAGPTGNPDYYPHIASGFCTKIN